MDFLEILYLFIAVPFLFVFALCYWIVTKNQIFLKDIDGEFADCTSLYNDSFKAFHLSSDGQSLIYSERNGDILYHTNIYPENILNYNNYQYNKSTGNNETQKFSVIELALESNPPKDITLESSDHESIKSVVNTVEMLTQRNKNKNSKVSVSDRGKKTLNNAKSKADKFFVQSFVAVSAVSAIGYFAFFFETESQKQDRIAAEEAQRIQDLGRWKVEERSILTNREAARNLDVDPQELVRKFGDMSQSTRDLHYDKGSTLLILEESDDSLTMSASYGHADELVITSLDFETGLPDKAIKYIDEFKLKTGVDTEEFKQLNDLLSVSSYECIGKVCYFELDSWQLSIVSMIEEFEVSFRGRRITGSGNVISSSQDFNIPTQGIIKNLDNANFKRFESFEKLHQNYIEMIKEQKSS